MSQPREQDLRNSILEGSTACMMGSLAGGAFLTGYALYLGASAFQIALITSLPLFATLLQLSSHFLVKKPEDRKRVTTNTIGLGRFLWIIIVLLPILMYDLSSELKLTIIMVTVTLSSALSSIGAITWWSWMSDLIPRDIMGTFFARRNLWCGLASIITFYTATLALDFYKIHVPKEYYPYGFAGLFFIGLCFGMHSWWVLRKITDPGMSAPLKKNPPLKELLLPLKDRNYRLYMIDRTLWTFSVFLAVPFFNVYLLKYLHADWNYIGLISLIASLTSIYCVRFWGRIIDQFGNKPILVIACYVKALYPFIWLFATPQNFFWLLILPNFLSAFDSAIGLTSGNLSIKLAPKGNNAPYLAVYITMSNLAAAIAPILGGLFIKYFSDPAGNLALPWMGDINTIKIIFFVSAALRFFSSRSLMQMREPETTGIRRMIKVLKEVKGVVPSWSEMDHAFNFWFRPLGDMRSAIATRLLGRGKDGDDDKIDLEDDDDEDSSESSDPHTSGSPPK